MKKISIITTYYNSSKYILDCVNSVIQQETSNFKIEYILVNDMSTDDSLDKIKAFLSMNKYKHAKLINKTSNTGCGDSRRLAISLCTGDYVMFLDSDDYFINKDFVKRAFNVITDEDADIVEYGIRMNNVNGKSKNSCIASKTVIKDKKEAALNILSTNAIRFNVWSKIYKKSMCDSYQYSTEREFEDVRTIPYWVNNATKIVIMPTVEINYRAVNDSIIRGDGVKTRLGTIKAMSELCELYKGDIDLLKHLYNRAFIDISAIMDGKCSDDEGFNEMSKLNTIFLSYIYPNYKKLVCNLESK